MPEFTVNTTDWALRCAREEFVGLLGSLDAKRPLAWQQFGYTETVTFAALMRAYQRGGAAYGAVHRILDKCWQQKPRIKKRVEEAATEKGAAKPSKGDKPAPKKADSDEPTPFEKSIDKLLRGINGWQKLRDLDRRNMVGRFSALIYRVADGKQLREPMLQVTKLVDIVPLYEDQIKVTDWHSDQADADNFGKPRMFQYRTHMPRAQDTQGQPEQWVDVHPSRVQILAEGSVGDMFEGVPLLLAGFNHLVDLEKISGGSAEGYLKNSARTVVVKFEPEASPQVITQNADGSASGKTVAEVIEENMQKLNRNVDASMVLQGGEATTLQTTMLEPGESFEVAANLFAASVRIPYTILFGQQTGRLASDEDQKDFSARCEARQDADLTPMIEEFVRRMQACGVIEAGDFEVEWPPLDAPGDDAKYAQVGKLTAAMQQAQSAGLTEPLFDANELRQVAGFDPRPDDGMPDEGELEAEAERERQHELALRGVGPGMQPPGAKPRIAAV
jgi:hypothetical protein